MKNISLSNSEIEIIANQYHVSEHRLREYLETNCITMPQNVKKAYEEIREKIHGEILLLEELISKKKNIQSMSSYLNEMINTGLPILVLTDEYGDHPQGSDPFSFYRKHRFKPLLVCANGTLMIYHKE